MKMKKSIIAVSACLLACVLAAGVQAQSDEESSEDILTLSPFEIKSDTDVGYASAYSLGGSRINTALDKLTLSVIPVNEQLMADLMPVDVVEAVQYVSGVAMTSTPKSNQFVVRGLRAQAINFRDGIQESATGIGHAHSDPIGLQRLEVVKGPAGILYGSHPLGGIVNRVTKKPMEGHRTHLNFELQSHDTYSFRVDTNNSFGEKDRIWTRFLFHYKDGHMRQGGKNDEISFIPMTTLVLSEDKNTQLHLRYNFNNFHYMEPRGLWFVDAGGNLPFGIVPVDAAIGNLGDPEQGTQVETHSFEMTFTHSFDLFGATWFMRGNARHRDQSLQFRIYLPDDKGIMGPDGELLRLEDGTVRSIRYNTTFEEYFQLKAAGEATDIVLYNTRKDVPTLRTRNRQHKFDETVISFDLNTEFDTGPLRHTLLTYTQFVNLDIWQNNRRWDWDAELQSIFNRQPQDPDRVLLNYRPDKPREPRREEKEGFNWAIQDNVSMFEGRLQLSGGIRYDWGRGATFNADGSFVEPETNTDWTTKYGVVFEPVKGVNLFYSNSGTFIPQSGVNSIGEKFENQEGLSDEIGVKLNLFDGRITATTSYFTIDFTNEKLSVDLPDGTSATRQLGTTVTEGWEADIFVRPIDQLDVLIGLQDIDTEILKTDGTTLSPRGVPLGFNYSFLAKYTFLGGPLKGFYAGITFKHINERSGDSGARFKVPGFEVWNAMLGYKRDKWQLRGFIDNLTDNEYLITPVGAHLQTPGDRRTFRFAIDYTF